MKTGSKTRQKRIGRKVGNIAAWTLGVDILAIAALCITMFYSLTMNMLEDQCVNGTNVLAYWLEQGGTGEDKTQLLDDLKEQMGCEFTIFNGDERAYTTIVQDGKRAVGTKLSSELSTIVLKQGKSYVGKAEILGVSHLCSYVPTKDENGQIDGLIFCGISTDNAFRQINMVIFLACLAAVIFIVLAIVILNVYIKGHVSHPLADLTALAKDMEQGELGIGSKKNREIEIHSNDEIGYLAHVFEQTIASLKGYISEIAAVLGAIADGNLTVRATREYVGDFASIKKSLDNILRQLRGTMAQTRESSEQVLVSSNQMSASAQALSQGAAQQASAVEELSATVNTISEHVGNNAQHSEEASRQAQEMAQELVHSKEQMDHMMESMEEISRSSDEIEKIIKTIEDIAFQTNILSLNASVEAQRAGEAGKGFAVVAGEVRTLAAKSAEASKSTSALIEQSVQAVRKGSKVADETAASINRLMGLSETTASLIYEISKASGEQAEEVAQVSLGIDQISGVVQTNSAMAEESAATSEELSGQAKALEDMIARFRL